MKKSFVCLQFCVILTLLLSNCKISEFVRANGILNPAKAVGEFNGTILNIDTNDVLTITNGKINSVIVM